MRRAVACRALPATGARLRHAQTIRVKMREFVQCLRARQNAPVRRVTLVKIVKTVLAALRHVQTEAVVMFMDPNTIAIATRDIPVRS